MARGCVVGSGLMLPLGVQKTCQACQEKTVPGSAATGGVGVKLKRMRLGGGSCRGRPCQGGTAMEEPLVQGLRPGDVLPVAHLEPEVAEAALQDCIGAIVEGRHVATAVDPDAFRGPQLLGQVLWQLLARRGTSALKGTAQLVKVGALTFLHNHAPCHDLSTLSLSLQPHLKTFVAPVLIGDFNYVLRWKSQRIKIHKLDYRF